MIDLMHYLQQYLKKTTHPKSEIIAYLATLDHLYATHPLIAKEIVSELHDQRSYLKMIASENYSSFAVQLAMGNLLTDKYSEGFPYHRFYAGCDHVDVLEGEAQRLAMQLFEAEHAYVQPHSGADANLVAFWAILTHKVQDPALAKYTEKNLEKLSTEDFESIRTLLNQQKMMGLSLDAGGHLTHGYRYNVSGKMFRSIRFGVHPKTHLIDYDEVYAIARKERPLILLVGYSAYPRNIDFAKMRDIANEVGAVLMVDMAHFSGLVAGKVMRGVHNPIPYADLCTTTTHKILRGPRGGVILSTQEYADVVNKGCPLVLGGPLPHVIASKAICFREALTEEYKTYAEQVVRNAQALAETLMSLGHSILTHGTDNHLVILDLSQHTMTGRQGEKALRDGGITANRNMIPYDANGPWYTSGVRLGTPAVTTLGMKELHMQEIGKIIDLLLRHALPEGKNNVSVEKYAVQESRNRVRNLLKDFPLYPELPELEVIEI